MRRFCMFCRTADILWNVPWCSLFASLAWQIWKRRNDVVFHNIVLPDASITSCSLTWAKHYTHNAILGAKSPSLVQLETLVSDAPELKWARLNVDGAVSVPLNAGKIGGLIQSKDGDWVVGFVKAISHSDVLHAELWALFEGMSLVWRYGFDSFLVCSDCKQVVELVNSPLAGSSVLSLVRAIHQLRQEHWASKVLWISRDDNHCADALAKLANPSNF
ncbi:hypothetical protein V6N11_021894 [Hibiscus sabdariffa]|uniref:RNase H type-1 domain-containing protein n=1 Tax=Hibiscus sabdariffa TaxID=183260 RepID=A0ABR2THK0_9ROSI